MPPEPLIPTSQPPNAYTLVLSLVQELIQDTKRLLAENIRNRGLCDELTAYSQKLDLIQRKVENFRDDYQNSDKTRQALQKAKAQIEALRAEVDKLAAPPNTFAIFSHMMGKDAVVFVSGRKMKVSVRPSVRVKELRKGQEVVLNEAFNIIEAAKSKRSGEVVKADALPEHGRIRIVVHFDETKMATLSDVLLREKISVGDSLLYDPQSEIVLEKLAKGEAREFFLEEVPDSTYDQIGGLDAVIEKIRRQIELPFLYPDDFRRYHKHPPKGMLLHGPPGCGKTLIAKAILNHLARRHEEEYKKKINHSFISINGPEMLNKYVGESERKIREVFQVARERASAGALVVIFIDEADAILQTRGTGISSDVNNTIVPQFLSEMDGMKAGQHVLVILASNRKDMIDPAILRPGRIDRKFLISRPDKEGARTIFKIYLPNDIPVHPKYRDSQHRQYKKETYDVFNGDSRKILDHMIEQAIRRLWATSEGYDYSNLSGNKVVADNRIAELTFTTGDKETLYLRDIVSGALIENIVGRATEKAVERKNQGGEDGLCSRDLCAAVEEEMVETEDVPEDVDTAQKWLDLQGRKGKIVHCRPLVQDRRREHDKNQRDERVETIKTGPAGHYF